MENTILNHLLVVIIAFTLVKTCLADVYHLSRANLDLYVSNSDGRSLDYWELRLTSVAQFIEHEILTQLPVDITSRIRTEKIQIKFNHELIGMAYFHGSTTHLKIELPLTYLLQNLNSYKEILVHEFFHLIHYRFRPNDPSWITEGLAQLFQFIITNRHTGINVLSAFEDISTPLIHDYHPDNMSRSQYGHNALYFYYLHTQCLNFRFSWDYLSHQDLDSVQNIDRILRGLNSNKPQCQSFLNSMINFEIARVYNRTNLVSDDNQDQFFIMPSHINSAPLLIGGQRELDQKINELLTTSSILIKISIPRIRLNLDARYSVVYISERFPYIVSAETTDRANSKILITKLQ